MPSNINFRLITVEPVLFLYMFCIFMSFPVMQQLAYHKICNQEFNDTKCKNLTRQQQNRIQQKTSHWILYQSIALTIPSIFSCLAFGSWSDSVGRKSIMILPPIGSAISAINFIININFFKLDVNYLLFGIVISGLFGGFATILSAVFSYMSDITVKTSRTLRIGILESMIFLGASTGELVAGILLDLSGFMATYGVVLGINICIVLYIALMLQESYSPEGDLVIGKTLIKIHKHLSHVWNVLFKPRNDNMRMILLVILFGVFSPVLISFSGFNDISLLYTMKEPLHFSPSYIGYFLAEIYFIKGIGVVFGLPIMTRILKLSDPVIGIVGLISSSAMYIFFGFSVHKWMMFVGAIFAIGGGITIPCMRSLMSKCVQPNEQGSMFAAVACFEVLYTLIASSIFNSLYSATVSWMPGFSFFLLAGFELIPIFILLWLYWRLSLWAQYRAMEHTDDICDPMAVNRDPQTSDDSDKLAC